MDPPPSYFDSLGIDFPRFPVIEKLPMPQTLEVGGGVTLQFGMVVRHVEFDRARESSYDRTYGVKIRTLVKHRDTGEMVEIAFTTHVHEDIPVPEAIYQAMRELLDHELRESIRVNGELWRNPHVEGCALGRKL